MLLNRLMLVAGILAVLGIGMLIYNAIHNVQYAKEKALALETYDRMTNHYAYEFAENLVSFEFVEPRVYRVETTGLDDPAAAGRFGFNAIAVLAMAEWDIETGQNSFTLYGYQDGEMIFEVYYTAGITSVVTLMGPFEEFEYTPSFNGRAPAPLPLEVSVRTSRA